MHVHEWNVIPVGERSVCAGEFLTSQRLVFWYAVGFFWHDAFWRSLLLLAFRHTYSWGKESQWPLCPLLLCCSFSILRLHSICNFVGPASGLTGFSWIWNRTIFFDPPGRLLSCFKIPTRIICCNWEIVHISRFRLGLFAVNEKLCHISRFRPGLFVVIENLCPNLS